MGDFVLRPDWLSRFYYLLQAGFHNTEAFAWKDDYLSEQPRQYTDVSALPVKMTDYLQHVKVVGSAYNFRLLAEPSNLEINIPRSIISIRGCPRLALLHRLGAELQLDPEPLLDHLTFPGAFRSRCLPSTDRKSVSLLLISLGAYENRQPSERFNIHQEAMDIQVAKHNADLLDQERDASGAEHCRAVNLHGSLFFSVEQRITFYPYRSTGGEWSIILLNDAGQPGQSSPWINPKHRSLPHFYPVDPNIPKSIWNPIVASKFLRSNPSVRRPDPCQSRAESLVGLSEELQNLDSEEPAAFLIDLLRTCAQSWALFFGFLREWHRHLEGDESQRAQILRHDKQILDRCGEFLSEILLFLKERSDFWTDWSCKEAKIQERIALLRTTILHDFEWLLQESKEISDLCKDAAAIEMTTINILDSKRGLAQADSVRVLTFLAYLFIPSAFIASVFGMNVREFTTPNPPLRSFLAVCIPFTAIFGLIPWARYIGNRLQIIYNYWIRSLASTSSQERL